MAVADYDALQGAKPQQQSDLALVINDPNNITKPVKSKEKIRISDDIIQDAGESAVDNESMDDLRHLLHLDKLIQHSQPTGINALHQEAPQNETIRLRVPEVESLEKEVRSSKDVCNSSCEFSKHWLPMLPLRTRRDEGIEFPDHADRLQHLLLMKAENESINTNEYYLQLLQREDNPGLLACDATRILPRELVEPPELFSQDDIRISPPLLPTNDSVVPFDPSGAATIIDLTSEPPSSIEGRADAFLKQAQDSHAESDIQETEILQTPSPNAESHWRLEKQPWTDGDKLEAPLVEMIPEISMDRINFATLLPNMVDMSSKLDDTDPDPFEDIFLNTVTAEALDVDSKLHAETIDPIDTISRIPIPNMNFVLDQPAWRGCSYSAQEHFKALHNSDKQIFALASPPPHCLVTGTLRWMPIPAGIPKISLDEQLQDIPYVIDEHTNRILCPVTTFDQLGADLSVLRFDDTEITDDELSDNATELLLENKSRKNQQNEPLDKWWLSVKRPINLDSVDQASSMLSSTNDSSVSSKLLANFMELHTTKRPRVETISTAKKDLAGTGIEENGNQPISIANREPLLVVIGPQFEVPAQKATFFVSLSVGQAMFRELTAYWPSDFLIDMDYSRVAHSASGTNSPNSEIPVEADLTLSPTACIVIVTVLEVRQKPLPGSKTETAIRSKLRKLVSMYETLHVLVSMDASSQHASGSPSSSDLAGYADFVQFTTCLEADITCYFIPGTKLTVSKWVIALMCRYSATSLQFNGSLSGETTTWEALFRRAGMNVFAAQVLSRSTYQNHGPEGISILLGMPSEQRLAQYSPLIGNKSLQQLSKAIDGSWRK